MATQLNGTSEYAMLANLKNDQWKNADRAMPADLISAISDMIAWIFPESLTNSIVLFAARHEWELIKVCRVMATGLLQLNALASNWLYLRIIWFVRQHTTK